MRVDLHNHTVLCNHAEGTTDEYIQRAIELGIDVYGFSEHAPMKNFEDGYRLTIDKKEFYENSINELKEKYSKDIKILLGYEVDFIEGDYLLDEIINSNVDYLIGSVHYLGDWGFDNPEYIGAYKNKDIDKIWEEYFHAINLMAKSGKFDTVGHMDLIKVFNFLPKKDVKAFAKDALESIKKSGMAVEINAAGIRKPVKEQYPSKSILELVYELDIPITFSSDAHSVEQVGFEYENMKNLAKEIGFTKCAYFEKRDMILTKF
jgi:histidinol-phosphatase (PHP family)